jgi:hypothetical protein
MESEWLICLIEFKQLEEGKIGETMLIGTAIRVLPKVIGQNMCEMGAKSINVDWILCTSMLGKLSLTNRMNGILRV